MKIMSVVLIALLCLTGCSLFQSADQQLIRGVEILTKPIIDEYQKYVIERKPLPNVPEDQLEERWRKIRRDSVKGLKDFLETAKNKE